MKANFLIPDWDAPDHVLSLVTTRGDSTCGFSQSPYDFLNLATHVEDNDKNVQKNRAALRALIPAEPVWLEQVHSTEILNITKGFKNTPVADASYTRIKNQVSAVMTADCLPVLFTNLTGTVVASAHAGWRGLLSGILEKTAAKISDNPDEILAWLGPAIGPDSFEVGAEVQQNFVNNLAQTEVAFVKKEHKFMADIYKLAKIHLAQIGVTRVSGGGLDTMTDKRFFSYRAQSQTGRMASLIWIR